MRLFPQVIPSSSVVFGKVHDQTHLSANGRLGMDSLEAEKPENAHRKSKRTERFSNIHVCPL
jgi:hypothetical protein